MREVCDVRYVRGMIMGGDVVRVMGDLKENVGGFYFGLV